MLRNSDANITSWEDYDVRRYRVLFFLLIFFVQFWFLAHFSLKRESAILFFLSRRLNKIHEYVEEEFAQDIIFSGCTRKCSYLVLESGTRSDYILYVEKINNYEINTCTILSKDKYKSIERGREIEIEREREKELNLNTFVVTQTLNFRKIFSFNVTCNTLTRDSESISPFRVVCSPLQNYVLR